MEPNARKYTQPSSKFLNSWLQTALMALLMIKIMEPKTWKSKKKMKSRKQRVSLSLLFQGNKTFLLLKEYLNLRQLRCLLEKLESNRKFQLWSPLRENWLMRSNNKCNLLFSSTIACSKTLFKKISSSTSIKFPSLVSKKRHWISRESPSVIKWAIKTI